MKLRRKLWLSAALCGAVFFTFRSCEPVNASAVDTVTLTPAQTRALFGDEISVTYFDGTDYQTGVLTYLTSSAELDEGQPDFGYSSYYSDMWGSLAPSGTRYIVYSANDLNIQSNSQYQITLEPQINFGNTLITKFVAGVSCSSSYSAQPRYSPYNYVSYYVNGNSFTTSAFQYGASPTVSMPYWAVVRFLIGSGQYQQARTFLMYPVAYNQDTYASINQFRFTADSAAAPASNICRFIVSCPTLSVSTSYGSEGGQTGTDLTATNAKLDSIINILSLISQQMEDNDSSGGNGNEGPAINVPLLLDNKLIEIDPELDFYFSDSPILGGSASGISSDGITPGGQVFLPDGQNVPMIAADPSGGGITTATTGTFGMLNDLLKTNPIMSKLIVLFLGGFIARWALFRGRGS